MRPGSILMEGAIVLPLWLVIFGGIFGLGQKGVDYIRVKGAERYAAEEAIRRGPVAGPSLPLMVTDAFLDRGIASDSHTTRQNHERSYLLLASGQSGLLTEDLVNFFGDMMTQPAYGIKTSDDRMPDMMTSSREGALSSRHTSFLLARTPRSTLSRRNWDPSLIVDKDIWKFSSDEDDDNGYPDKWDESMKGVTPAKDPNWNGYSVKKPYSRSSRFIGWSGKAVQDED